MQGLKDNKRKYSDRDKRLQGNSRKFGFGRPFVVYCKGCPNLQELEDKERKEKKRYRDKRLQGSSCKFVLYDLKLQFIAKAVQICKDSKTKKEKKRKDTETNAFRGVLANSFCKTLNCSLPQRLSKFARSQRQRKKRKRQRQTPSVEFLQIWSVRPFEVYYKGCPNLQGLKDKERKEKDRRFRGSSCKFGL